MQRKILVVEDDRDICELIADMLSETGAQIFTAFNGTDALNRLESDQLHLAIIDLLFAGPVSSDIVVQHAKDKRCPVITMSGTLASDRRGRDLGTPHLIKPIRALQLVSLVERTLAGDARPPLLLG